MFSSWGALARGLITTLFNFLFAICNFQSIRLFYKIFEKPRPKESQHAEAPLYPREDVFCHPS